MALINNIYGPDSAEARGSLSIYIVGGMVGTIYFGLMASVVGNDRMVPSTGSGTWFRCREREL